MDLSKFFKNRKLRINPKDIIRKQHGQKKAFTRPPMSERSDKEQAVHRANIIAGYLKKNKKD